MDGAIEGKRLREEGDDDLVRLRHWLKFVSDNILDYEEELARLKEERVVLQTAIAQIVDKGQLILPLEIP